jgi:negative regulator of sigma E activity
MNCFEARRDFAALWRRELSDQRRAALSEHLTRCTKCERAFRAFALTAPVLHSPAEPAGRGRETRATPAGSSRRLAVADRPHAREGPRWFAMCAAVTVFVAASLAAWLAVTTPVESLGDALSTQDQSPAAQLFEQSTADTSNDFAG